MDDIMTSYGDEGFAFEGLFFLLLGILFIVIPFWRIFSKAGYSGWLSILMIFPLVNIIVLYFLAFAKWPILKKTVYETIEK